MEVHTSGTPGGAPQGIVSGTPEAPPLAPQVPQAPQAPQAPRVCRLCVLRLSGCSEPQEFSRARRQQQEEQQAEELGLRLRNYGAEPPCDSTATTPAHGPGPAQVSSQDTHTEAPCTVGEGRGEGREGGEGKEGESRGAGEGRDGDHRESPLANGETPLVDGVTPSTSNVHTGPCVHIEMESPLANGETPLVDGGTPPLNGEAPLVPSGPCGGRAHPGPPSGAPCPLCLGLLELRYTRGDPGCALRGPARSPGAAAVAPLAADSGSHSHTELRSDDKGGGGPVGPAVPSVPGAELNGSAELRGAAGVEGLGGAAEEEVCARVREAGFPFATFSAQVCVPRRLLEAQEASWRASQAQARAKAETQAQMKAEGATASNGTAPNGTGPADPPPDTLQLSQVQAHPTTVSQVLHMLLTRALSSSFGAKPAPEPAAELRVLVDVGAPGVQGGGGSTGEGQERGRGGEGPEGAGGGVGGRHNKRRRGGQHQWRTAGQAQNSGSDTVAAILETPQATTTTTHKAGLQPGMQAGVQCGSGAKGGAACSLAVRVSRMPVFVGGRYLKFSRQLSQSPWTVDDERIGEGSVQECIADLLMPHFAPQPLQTTPPTTTTTTTTSSPAPALDPLLTPVASAPPLAPTQTPKPSPAPAHKTALPPAPPLPAHKFRAAGREDLDVRMLGSGRPFLIEVLEPRRVPGPEELRGVQEEINRTHKGKVGVRDLCVVGREAAAMMREGEQEKQKSYCCVVALSRPVTAADFELLDSTTDLVLDQSTPIRVLHRRSPMVRPRTIYRMRCEKIPEDPTLFLLHLTTQAGTYVKEFVHGDFGRTQPNLGSLLDCEAQILQLDVTDVKMDFSFGASA